MNNELIGYISIPLYKLPEKQYTGFRQNMLEAGPHSVGCEAGLGGDRIYSEIGVENTESTEYYYIFGRDILAASLDIINYPDHDLMPASEHYQRTDNESKITST